jgi:hypothetical protein
MGLKEFLSTPIPFLFKSMLLILNLEVSSCLGLFLFPGHWTQSSLGSLFVLAPHCPTSAAVPSASRSLLHQVLQTSSTHGFSFLMPLAQLLLRKVLLDYIACHLPGHSSPVAPYCLAFPPFCCIVVDKEGTYWVPFLWALPDHACDLICWMDVPPSNITTASLSPPEGTWVRTTDLLWPRHRPLHSGLKKSCVSFKSFIQWNFKPIIFLNYGVRNIHRHKYVGAWFSIFAKITSSQ